MFYQKAPGDFEVNGKPVKLENPKAGRVVPLEALTPQASGQ
jgi:hypothetical protein